MTQSTGHQHQASPIRGPDDFAAAFHVSRETLDRLAVYEGLLRHWQKTINLVSPSTLHAIWHRHFADSAQLLALAPTATTWVDLGSGAGFPGMVVALMLADRESPSPRSSRGEGRGEGRQNAPEQAPPLTLTLSPQRAGRGDYTPALPSSTAMPANAPSCARWSAKSASRRASLWISCRQESRPWQLKLGCAGRT